MEKKLDKSAEIEVTPMVELTESENPENTSRRQFSRRAMLGGAVVLSLANRPAWAGWQTECISTGFLASYMAAGGAVSRAPGGKDPAAEAERIQKKLEEWKALVDAPDNNYRYAPNSKDNETCLQKRT